ncbi:MAG: glycoside hydrolase family 88 protein [Clostridia bacterium]|nr:glycoside hydrolase family 88 protein [Clostridia bacterium]
MNKDIILEKIKQEEKFLPEPRVTKEFLTKALGDALKKIDRLIDDMKGDFPSHASENNVYTPVKNESGWNTGFWSGMLWLAYEATGEEKYLDAANGLLESFYERIDKKLGIDMHDLGFVYMPSCVAAYKLTGNEKAKEYALRAADHLMTRYHADGGYIQAWGKMGEQLRLIVDCMNNIPLLYWASEVTGDSKYYDVAYTHAKTTIEYIVRPDASTFHTYFFNTDGTPDRGTTHQGASDDSCWARGQAWLISGLPLSYKYTKDSSMLPLFDKITSYYLNRLPDDYIPYWDLIFTSGDEPRDSSAAAIALCGILENISNMEDSNPLKETYKNAADRIMYSLYNSYSTKDTPESNGLLLHAVYAKPMGIGVDECNIWGCYYYMEALVRMLKGTKAYW